MKTVTQVGIWHGCVGPITTDLTRYQRL